MEDKKYDVYQYLNEVTSEEEKELDAKDEYEPLPQGYVTDGYGKYYKLPTEGKTPLVSLEKDWLKYCYNWETKSIEVYLKNENAEDKYELFDEFDLSAGDFVDNPKYWYSMLENNYQDLIDMAVSDIKTTEVSEFLDSYSNAAIQADVVFKFAGDDTENLKYYANEYNNYIKSLDLKAKLYGEEYKAVFNYNPDTMPTKILITFIGAGDLSDENIVDLYADILAATDYTTEKINIYLASAQVVTA